MLRALPLLLSASVAVAGPPDGLIVVPGDADVPTTVAALRSAVEAKGLTIVAEVDHAAAAQAAGLELAPSVLLIFGNPKVGTPLMQAAPTAGLDLPLKVLVYADAAGTHLAYTEPTWIAARHGAGAATTVSTMARALPALVAKAADAAAD